MEVDASNGSGSGRSNGSGVSGQDAADSDSNWWLGRNGQAAADMDMGGEEDSSYETLLLGHGNGRDRGELVNTIAAGEDDGGYYNEGLLIVVVKYYSPIFGRFLLLTNYDRKNKIFKKDFDLKC
jgi:hypothetical protein